jgi:polar amino acid transport system substrate-binding protein
LRKEVLGLRKGWKTFCITALLFIFAVMALTGCSSSSGQGALAGIQKKGKIIVGTASGYYPFEMVDKQGNLVGYDIDVAKALAKDLGVEVEFQNYAFSGLIPALQANKVDVVIAGMTITDKRKETVDFAEPYFVSGQALLVNKNYPGVKTWQDLDKPGNVIAVSMGTTAEQTASSLFKQATVKKFEGSALAGLELTNGKATAVIHETPWVIIYNKLNPDTTYAISEPFTTENLGIAVNKGKPDLVEALNKFITKYKQSPEYEQAHHYWFVDLAWWDAVPQKK